MSSEPQHEPEIPRFCKWLQKEATEPSEPGGPSQGAYPNLQQKERTQPKTPPRSLTRPFNGHKEKPQNTWGARLGPGSDEPRVKETCVNMCQTGRSLNPFTKPVASKRSPETQTFRSKSRETDLWIITKLLRKVQTRRLLDINQTDEAAAPSVMRHGHGPAAPQSHGHRFKVGRDREGSRPEFHSSSTPTRPASNPLPVDFRRRKAETSSGSSPCQVNLEERRL